MPNKFWTVEYVTEGGCHGTVKRNMLENAKSASERFARKNAHVRIIEHEGNGKTRIIEER